MIAGTPLGRLLLDQAYATLLDRREVLLDVQSNPEGFVALDGDAETWTDLGDWLQLASRLGAEKVLFRRGEPIIVFGELEMAPDDIIAIEVRRFYRRAWCMSEPRCLFIALPDELRVYLLDQPPEIGKQTLEAWTTLHNVGEVLTLLRDESALGPDLSGLSEAGVRTAPTRADQQLIDDLRYVRDQLQDAGLNMAQAHALIGRSILVRYLEDRGVLTRAYFEEVARGNPSWETLLAGGSTTVVFSSKPRERFYDRVLGDADFTHALFARLADTFNGDLFALGDVGERVGEQALRLLQRFLLGEAQADQPPLFFWAYDFEVVPLSLISSLYEQFYHDSRAAKAQAGGDEGGSSGVGDSDPNDEPPPDEGEAVAARPDRGTHYTPATLVHDALHRTLTPACLAGQPRVLDLACGSGIFLVEAFRRIVRFEAHAKRRKLLPTELRTILRDRIVGVEINDQAARVAAFSLYLALLDQQEPPEIMAGDLLPHLIHSGTRDDRHYSVIVVGDAFALTEHERVVLRARVAAKARYKGRANDVKLLDRARDLTLAEHGFDVVIGNPPWHEALPTESVARAWAASFGYPTGESSYSQLFIHRSLTMLRQGGLAGLLVGMKVFWNDRDTSRTFRRQLLARASVRQVVNMAHVRHVFFANGVAPFAFLLLENSRPASDHRLVLWNARRTRAVETLRSMALVPLERSVLTQRDVVDADYLWKTYWWGNHHDAALVGRLALERTLGETVTGMQPRPRYGWQRGPTPPTGPLAMLPELDNKAVQPFGPLRDDWFKPPPTGIKRNPDQRIYGGLRLVITRGVREPIGGPVARLETTPFSFRHMFFCVPLPNLRVDEAKLVLGVLWSSLGRYRLFMSAGSWGGWHDQVTERDLLSMPVRLAPSWGMPQSEHDAAAARIIAEVDKLRGEGAPTQAFATAANTAGARSSRHKARRRIGGDLFGAGQVSGALAHLSSMPPSTAPLDEAVFDLFELSRSERDLVADFWAENHDLYWKGAASRALSPVSRPAVMQGTAATLLGPIQPGNLQRYLAAFLGEWNPKLPPGFEFAWQVAASSGSTMFAVAFTLVELGALLPAEAGPSWEAMLEKCSAATEQPVSPAFLVDRIIRATTPKSFVFVKPSMRRLWTASAAREDAEAVFLRVAATSRAA